MKLELDEINGMWAKDSVFDQIDLEGASRDTGRLHQKYLQLFQLAKLQLSKRERERKVLFKERWLYFTGKMTPAEISAKGWVPDPFDGLKIMRSDMDTWFDADPLLQAADEKIAYLRTVLETLEDIMNMIRWRHQHLRIALDYRKFIAGN